MVVDKVVVDVIVDVGVVDVVVDVVDVVVVDVVDVDVVVTGDVTAVDDPDNVQFAIFGQSHRSNSMLQWVPGIQSNSSGTPQLHL